MFFKFDEKTVADMVRNQQKREEERRKAEESVIDYKGHKLQFAVSVDGNAVILSDPPLITEKADQGQTDEPIGPVDVFVSGTWKRKT